jgi:hypothetical protein
MISYLRPTPLVALGALLLSAPALAQTPAGTGKTQEGSWFPSETKDEAPRPAGDAADEADEADETEETDEADAKPAPKPAPPVRPAPAPRPPAKAKPAAPAAKPAAPPRARGKMDIYLGGSGVSGKLNSDRHLRSEVESAALLGIDGQLYVSRHLALGAYAEYGGVTRQGPCPPNTVAGCEDVIFRVGVSAQYHFRPAVKGVDPWLGVGAGVTTLTFKDQRANGSGADVTYAGVDLLNLQAGVDFAIDRVFALGPYVAFNNGVYTNAVVPTRNDPHARLLYGADNVGGPGQSVSTAFHTWTTLGVRARFNFF